MYTVFTVNECTHTQYERGSYHYLMQAVDAANEEIGPRARTFLRAVVLNPEGKNVYETRGKH